MSETLDNVNAEAGKRPTFLTVLCILSFIGAGISIILILIATVFATGATMVANGAMEGASAEAQQAVDAASGVMANMWGYIIAAVVMIIVSLFGVIQMWKLKKSGFYLYTGAAVAGIIVDIALGAGLSTMGVIISVAFIAMYAANLKAMK